MKYFDYHNFVLMICNFHVSFCTCAHIGLSVPTNVRATVLTPYSIKVNWDQTSDATGYLISYNSTANNGSVSVNGRNTTSYALTNLEQNIKYTITVQATSTSKDKMSAKSNIESVTTSADGKK